MGIFSRIFSRRADAEPSIPTTPAARPVVAQAPPKAKAAPVGVTYKVAGVSFYEDNIMSLALRSSEYTLSKRELIEEGLTDERVWEYEFYPDKVEVVPEPDNPEDPKALKVLVDGVHVGYIKKGSCARLRRLMDGDRIQRIDVEMGGGRYKYVETDYTESGKETYTMDRGDVPLFVHLCVYEKPQDDAET